MINDLKALLSWVFGLHVFDLPYKQHNKTIRKVIGVGDTGTITYYDNGECKIFRYDAEDDVRITYRGSGIYEISVEYNDGSGETITFTGNYYHTRKKSTRLVDINQKYFGGISI
jgi:hypothetical protein